MNKQHHAVSSICAQGCISGASMVVFAQNSIRGTFSACQQVCFYSCSVSCGPHRQSLAWCHTSGWLRDRQSSAGPTSATALPAITGANRALCYLQAHAVCAEAQLLKGRVCGEHITNGLTPSILQPVESPAGRIRSSGGSGIDNSGTSTQSGCSYKGAVLRISSHMRQVMIAFVKRAQLLTGSV